MVSIRLPDDYLVEFQRHEGADPAQNFICMVWQRPMPVGVPWRGTRRNVRNKKCQSRRKLLEREYSGEKGRGERKGAAPCVAPNIGHDERKPCISHVYLLSA